MASRAERRRFVVRWTETASPPPEDAARLLREASIRVIDATPRMLLIEAIESDLRALVADMPGWRVVPEKELARPEPRKKARRSR